MLGRRTHRLTGIALCCAAALTAQVHPARAETLASVVQHAIDTHPELGAIRNNRRAIDHELTAARGQQLPTFDVQAETGRHRNSTENELGIKSGDNWHRHREISTILSQRLFDGFETTHEIARQKNRVESARWRVTDTANSIALRAVQAYLEILRARTVFNLAQRNFEAHRRLLTRVQRRVSAGGSAASDSSEAIGRTANAQAIMAEAEARLLDADSFYWSVINAAPDNLQVPHVPGGALPRSVDAAITQALVAAPSVIATQHDTTAAQAGIGTAYSRFYPRVNFELGTEHGWGITESADDTLDVRAMVVVRWNLFNGGIDKARLWEAKARAREASEIAENTKRIIERETRVSWNAMRSAEVRMPILRRQVEQSRATRDSYNRQYDGGQRRLLDLLNIQAEVFIAESSLRTEEFVHVYNSFRILAAMGQLVPALGLSLPEEGVTPFAPTVIDGWVDGWSNWSTSVSYHSGSADSAAE